MSYTGPGHEMFSTYLQHVHFHNMSLTQAGQLKVRLMQALAIDEKELYGRLSETIPDRCELAKEMKWKDCVGDCYNVAHDAVKTELQSTAYILRCLANSVLPEPGLSFEVTDMSRLTGEWSKDYKHIQLKIPPGETRKHGRLILGLGPSASGKTYWSKTIIELFASADPRFPRFFISIDGGIYRECSLVYDVIRRVATDHCYNGFKNLTTAGLKLLKAKSIFNAGKVKKIIVPYLKTQAKTLPISLYVPDTLAGCGQGIPKTCASVYKKYIQLTRDKHYIGLCIFQHQTGKDCSYKEGYRCVGTVESGKAREIKEGKKYSSTAWERSMVNGIEQTRTCPYAYVIHNSGQKEQTSTLFDLKPDLLFSDHLEKHGKSHGYLYVNAHPRERSVTMSIHYK